MATTREQHHDGRDPSAELESLQTERLAEFGGIIVVGFAASVVLLYGFARLANEVLEQETTAMDAAALQFLQQFSSSQLTTAAQLISLMGSEAVVVIGAILLAVLAWQRRWGAAVMLVLVTAGAQVLNDILKELFRRTRPAPVSGFLDAQQFSFPSGHAMVSAAFYFYIAFLAWRLHGWWRGVLVVSLVVLVLLIGIARIYLEAHYLSDVIAGYLAGFLWADAVMLGSRVLTLRRRRRLRPRTRTLNR